MLLEDNKTHFTHDHTCRDLKVFGAAYSDPMTGQINAVTLLSVPLAPDFQYPCGFTNEATPSVPPGEPKLVLVHYMIVPIGDNGHRPHITHLSLDLRDTYFENKSPRPA